MTEQKSDATLLVATEAEPPVMGQTGSRTSAETSSTERSLPIERDERAADEPAPFWLRRGDQLVLAVLCSALLVLSLWHWASLSGWGMRPVEVDRHPSRQYEFRIEINSATWVEWIQLPNIGETLARRIIADREERGPFESVEDLQRVKGIGPKTIENLRPYLRVDPQ